MSDGRAHPTREPHRPRLRRCTDVSPRRVAPRASSTTRSPPLPPFTLMARAGDAVARLALALAPHARARRRLRRAGQQRRRRHRGGDAACSDWGKRGVGAVASAAAARCRPMPRRRSRARAPRASRSAASIAPTPTSAERRPSWSSTRCSASAPRARPRARSPRRSRASPQLAARGARVLAVDVPSGLDAERGQPLGGACVVADDTLTLIAPKPGLFTGAGRDHAGRVWLRRARRRPATSAADAWLVGRRRSARARLPARAGRAQGQLRRRRRRRRRASAWPAPPGSRRAPRTRRAPAASSSICSATGRARARSTPRLDPLRPELMLRPRLVGERRRRRSPRPRSSAAAAAAMRCARRCRGCCRLAPRLVLDADALNAIAADASLLALAAARAGARPRDHPHAASARSGAPARRTAGAVQARPAAGGARAGRTLPRRRRPERLGHRRSPAPTARGAHQRDRQRLARQRRHRRRARRLDRRPLGALGGTRARRATRGVIEHGAAAEPERRPARCAPAT